MSIYPDSMQHPRVLIVENDLRTRESLQALISHWGYNPIIATGEGENLATDAIQKAKEHRCQLALVDLRLIDDFDNNDISGIELARQIKPTQTIINTGYPNIPVAVDNIRNGTIASFILKGEAPEKINNELREVGFQVSASERQIEISPNEIILSLSEVLFEPNLPDLYRDQLLDTLARLFPNAKRLELEKLDQGSTISFAEVPRPRSVILQIREDGLQPVIVKLARAHKIDREVQRYHRHIDRRLLRHAAPNIGRTEILWDIGGIKFVYNGTIRKNFEHLFKSENINTIGQTLDRFFNSTWSDHYKKARKVKNVSLLELYRRVLEDNWLYRIKQFPQLTPEKSMGKERWEMLGASNPLDWFFHNIFEHTDSIVNCAEETYLAVTHGDLHAGNILIDDANNAWVIDFERTGVGHILQDFVELETDLINRMVPGSENFPLYHRLCYAVAAPEEIGPIENHFDLTDPNSLKLIQTISIIRSLARDCSNLTDFRQYLVGLLFNTLFRATIIKDTNNHSEKKSQERALMLASIICHRLDHWDEPWPPKEWENL